MTYQYMEDHNKTENVELLSAILNKPKMDDTDIDAFKKIVDSDPNIIDIVLMGSVLIVCNRNAWASFNKVA